MSNARELALLVLNRLNIGRENLDQLMASAEMRINALKRADRALFHALVYGTLRHRTRLDRLVDLHLRRSSKKIDPVLRNILRMGVFQIRYLDRIPVSAAVHTAVEMTKSAGKGWAAGFVNGVLRNIARAKTPDRLPDPDRRPVEFLSLAHSFPRWLMRRWLERWGFHHTDAMCRAINTIPALTIRTNTIKTDRETLMVSDAESSGRFERSRFSPEGLHVSAIGDPISRWQAFRDGLFQVQSEAAQLVGHLLQPEPYQTVWDACAGLGTKTGHLAQLMQNRGVLLASDRNEEKLVQLRTEMDRLGISIVTTQVVDLAAEALSPAAGPFDRILLDAPCSGLGVLQRNPDGKWRTTAADISRQHARQRVMIDAVSHHLKPGGILVFAVCSLEPEENEAVINVFLQNHPEFDIFSPESAEADQFSALRTPDGFLRTSPHPHGLDGFFAAALQRRPR